MKNKNYFRSILVQLITCILFFCTTTKATNYLFSSSASTYTPISGGRMLGTPGNISDCYLDTNNVSVGINPAPNGNLFGIGFPLGFNFQLDTIVCNRFAVCADGWIFLGAGNFGINAKVFKTFAPFFNTASGFAVNGLKIAALVGGLASNVSSSLSYKVIGTAPNRTLVVQWQNFARDSSMSDTLNFQLRLNETSNTIEAVYGSMTLSNVFTDMQVGLAVDFDKQLRKTTTNWNTTFPECFTFFN